MAIDPAVLVNSIKEIILRIIKLFARRRASTLGNNIPNDIARPGSNLADAKAEIDRLQEELKLVRSTSSDLVFAGWYLPPNGEKSLMMSITSFLTSVRTDRAMPRLELASDFAAFGAVTWRDEFALHRMRLMELVRASKLPVQRVEMVFNSKEVNRQILAKQFPDTEWRRYVTGNAERIRSWLADDAVAIAVTAPRNGMVQIMTHEQLQAVREARCGVDREVFIEAFLEFNERVIREYKDAGASVARYCNPVPIHAWLEQDGNGAHRGVFGIADTLAVWNEPGFQVAGAVAGVVWNLVRDVHERARDNDTC